MRWSTFSTRRKSTGKQSYSKANRASHGPRVSPHSQAKKRVQRTRENPKENRKEPIVRTKLPKFYTRAKHRKLVSQVLQTRNPRHIQVSAQTCTTDTSWNDGCGILLDCTKVGNKRMTLPQGNFHLGVWMLVPPEVRSGLNG